MVQQGGRIQKKFVPMNGLLFFQLSCGCGEIRDLYEFVRAIGWK